MSGLPTIKDVAYEAGVATSTVSRALRDHPKISKRTRLKVREAADRVGYRSHPLVSVLMSQLRATKPATYNSTIAFLDTSWNPDETIEWGTMIEFKQGIEERGDELGYKVDYFDKTGKGVTHRNLIRQFRARGIDGLIIGYLPSRNDPSHAIDLDLQGFACASIGVRLDSPALHFIGNDHYNTMAMALERVAALGYQRIGLALDYYVHGLVENKFVAALLDYQRNLPIKRRVAPLVSESFGEESFGEWFEQASPDIVIGIDLEVIDWIKRRGWRIPDEVGYVNLDLMDDCGAIAGINQRNRISGRTAMEVVVNQLQYNERGVPEYPKSVMVKGVWKMGKTVRDVRG